MQHIENIVIGKPLVSVSEMFSVNKEDWESNEQSKTIHIEERFLPKILVDIGFTSSTSEIRRNRKDLVKTLDKLDFMKIKLGKNICWILVGK